MLARTLGFSGATAVESLVEFAWYMAADMEPLPKHRKRVEALEEAGKCLCEGCTNDARSRGRCDHHLWAYRMLRLQTPKSRRGELEKQLILRGELLPNRQGKRNDLRKNARAS